MSRKLIICLWIFIINGVFGVGKDEMKTEEVKTVLGQSVTLHSGVEEYHQIFWMFEETIIAKCRGNTDGTVSCEITDERLKTDDQTGSLTIISISPELTGLYKLQIINRSSKTSSHKQFSVTVSALTTEADQTGLNWGLILGLGLGLGLPVLLVLGVVIYCCCCRNSGRNGDVYQYVENGGTVFRKISSCSFSNE